MAKQEKLYKKLPGVARLFSYSRLWMAEDHLLLVTRRTFSESYRRFYFTDIESFSICRTAGRKISISTWLIMEGVFGGLLLWSYFLENGGALNSLACVGLGVAALMLARTIFLGPTCICQVRTAVQAVELKSLRRLRAARKVQQAIAPLIQAAQGLVSPDQLGVEDPEPVPVVASRFAIPLRHEQEMEIRHESGRYHLLFFLVFLLGVPSGIFDIYYTYPIKDHLDAILAGACVILAIIAMTKQARSDIPAAVRYLVWAGVLLVSLEFGLVLTAASVVAMVDPLKYLERPVTDPRQLCSASAFAVLCALFSAASGIIGALGLLRLSEFRSARALSGVSEASAAPDANSSTEPGND